MVPKGSFPIDFKISSKGLSWVDLMYQKFEAICEEVDKNPSALFQETTKFIEHGMSTVGVNVQKFCAEIMDDIIPPITEIDDKCLKLSINSEEDFKLTEKSGLEGETIETSNCESVASSQVNQKASIEIGESDLTKQLCSSFIQKENVSAKSTEEQKTSIEIGESDSTKQLCSSWLQEENISTKSTEEELAQVNSTDFNLGADPSEEGFEDKGILQEKICLCEHAEPLIRQTNLPVQSDIKLVANITGVEGIADQGKNESMDLSGRIKLEDSSSPADKTLVENGILELNLKEAENVQNHPDGDGERVLSVVETFTTNTPTFSKEGHLDESLYLALNEKDQSACWYGNPFVDAKDGIGMSSSNYFLNITDDRCPDVGNSDSEWELVEDIPA